MKKILTSFCALLLVLVFACCSNQTTAKNLSGSIKYNTNQIRQVINSFDDYGTKTANYNARRTSGNNTFSDNSYTIYSEIDSCTNRLNKCKRNLLKCIDKCDSYCKNIDNGSANLTDNEIRQCNKYISELKDIYADMQKQDRIINSNYNMSNTSASAKNRILSALYSECDNCDKANEIVNAINDLINKNDTVKKNNYKTERTSTKNMTNRNNYSNRKYYRGRNYNNYNNYDEYYYNNTRRNNNYFNGYNRNYRDMYNVDTYTDMNRNTDTYYPYDDSYYADNHEENITRDDSFVRDNVYGRNVNRKYNNTTKDYKAVELDRNKKSDNQYDTRVVNDYNSNKKDSRVVNKYNSNDRVVNNYNKNDDKIREKNYNNERTVKDNSDKTIDSEVVRGRKIEKFDDNYRAVEKDRYDRVNNSGMRENQKKVNENNPNKVVNNHNVKNDRPQDKNYKATENKVVKNNSDNTVRYDKNRVVNNYDKTNNDNIVKPQNTIKKNYSNTVNTSRIYA